MIRYTALLCFLAVSASADTRQDCVAKGGAWATNRAGEGCEVKGKREGVWKKFAAGGQLEARSSWANGKLDGPFATFHPNCQLAEEGAFKAGLRDGPWKFYDEQARPTEEGTFVADVKSGTWATYHPQTKQKHLEGPYVKGKANGVFQEWLPSGTKWRDAEFKDDERVGPGPAECLKRQGMWTVDPQDRKEGCLVEGNEEGVWQAYDTQGKLRWRSTYVHGRETGWREDFHPTGALLRKGEYRDSQPTGVHTFLAPDGTPYGRSAIINGTGKWEAFHPNGKVSESAMYQQGCVIGYWRTFDEDGRAQLADPYQECRRDGLFTVFHTNGQKALEGHYRKGKRVGIWHQYYFNGDLEWEGEFVDDQRTGDWRFMRWGKKPRSQGPMANDRPTGQWTEFHPTGEKAGVGEMQGKAKSGEWKTWWATGEAWRDVQYDRGQEKGPALQCAAIGGEWKADPERRALGCLVCRVDDDNSIRQIGVGWWTFWHPSGAIEKQGELVEGAPWAEWSFFHDNGTPMMRGSFADGGETGRWAGQYRDGAKRFSGVYLQGKPHGVWTSWHPDGGLLSEGSYDAGIKLGRWVYVRRGREVAVEEKPKATSLDTDSGVP